MSKPLTEDERAAFEREYDIAMRGGEAGPGWPVLWQKESEALAQRCLPACMEAGLHMPGETGVNFHAGQVFGPLDRWPWTAQPHGGLLADPFARAVRWAWHCRYDEAEAFYEDAVDARDILRRKKTVSPLHAFMEGSIHGREQARTARKGLPPGGRLLTRDVRRAVLVGFLGSNDALPAYTTARPSAVLAVALAEFVVERVDQTSVHRGVHKALATLRGEVAVALMARMPGCQWRDRCFEWRPGKSGEYYETIKNDELVRCARTAWKRSEGIVQSACRIIKGDVAPGEREAWKAIWEVNDLSQPNDDPMQADEKGSTHFGSIRDNWRRFKKAAH